MAEFKPIMTQEEFDEAIKSRLDRQEKTITARFSDYDALKEAAAKHDEESRSWATKAQENADAIKKLKAELETANKTIKANELNTLRSSIAAEIGLPAELRDRITGNTPEELRKDAEALKAVFEKNQRAGLPGFSSNKAPSGDPKEDALRELLGKLHIES